MTKTTEPELMAGDLVEAVKGFRVVRDIVHLGAGPIFGGRLYLGVPSLFGTTQIESYIESGYTLILIDRTKPPVVLPTEVGYYIACDGGMDRIEFEGELLPERYAPYTKLEPVAETAKRVLDRVMDATGAAPTSFTSEKILEVAAEFGATS